MLRIVEVIPTLGVGGAESMVRDYCLLADKNEYDISVIVLTEHKNTPIEQELEKAGVKIVYLGEQVFKNCDLNRFQKLIRKLSRYCCFRKTILQIKPEVIHLHLQIGKYMRTLPLCRLKSRLFLTVHNVPERYFSKEKTLNDKYKEYKEVFRLVHKHEMTILTLHDNLKDELKRLFSTDRIITLYNGIRMERFNPELYDAKTERKKLGIDETELIVGHVGSMHVQKNHELILRVFERFHEINPRSKLLLVGDGELKSLILERIEEYGLNESIIILSNRGDIPELMSTMDAFLFPSKWEGFGNVLIEAQCMGLPCVVSDAVPTDVRITNNVHVVSLDASIDEWISTLTNAINGVEGLVAVNDKETFDMSRCIKKLEAIYSNKLCE